MWDESPNITSQTITRPIFDTTAFVGRIAHAFVPGQAQISRSGMYLVGMVDSEKSVDALMDVRDVVGESSLDPDVFEFSSLFIFVEQVRRPPRGVCVFVCVCVGHRCHGRGVHCLLLYFSGELLTRGTTSLYSSPRKVDNEKRASANPANKSVA